MAKKVTKKVAPKKSVAAKKEVSIPALLKELAACTDQLEKRKLRAKLRKAGHTGGISGKDSKVKAKAKAPKGKKGKKGKAVVEDDDDE